MTEDTDQFARRPMTPLSPFELNREGKGQALVLRYAGCNLRCSLCYAWKYAWFPQEEGCPHFRQCKRYVSLLAWNHLYFIASLHQNIVSLICERYSVRFACLADMPVERGIAKLAGMNLLDLPPPSRNLKGDSLLRVRELLKILALYDCFYIHIKGPDEPGHDGDFQLKKKLINTIDRHFFGELLQKINSSDYLVCVTADHSTPCMLKTHSDDPVPILISGDKVQGDNISKFSEKECQKGSLGILQKGTQLMPMLMNLLKKMSK